MKSPSPRSVSTQDKLNAYRSAIQRGLVTRRDVVAGPWPLTKEKFSMKNLYARAVLFLIAPALMLKSRRESDKHQAELERTRPQREERDRRAYVRAMSSGRIRE